MSNWNPDEKTVFGKLEKQLFHDLEYRFSIEKYQFSECQ